jgi:hypothetical protein
MSLLISGDLRLHMPLFPTSPAPTNGDTWTDPVTSVSMDISEQHQYLEADVSPEFTGTNDHKEMAS